ncbi:hypothetical protein K431DRAFT_317508 [Polychaeton citri CBS 116435]|uniref:Thioesterase/thiol ester dehydrase-isomerase n=1 Tax=Polychaeton citri CBS 116435 TaxID=1314669 RepID=A0A9P4QE01_9PEZI|nr:hypothetical protein K431DRAFT_317508 [Polychaeton citri CBS 116435]
MDKVYCGPGPRQASIIKNVRGSTTVQQADSHTYLANFDDDWTIGTVPHGGYVTSTFQRVVKKHFETTLKKQNQPHTIALHIDFLRRTGVGPATFKVKDVKLGRQTSVVHVTLTQEDREEAVAYITNSNMTLEQGPTFATKWELAPSLPPIDLARLETGNDAKWAERKAWPFEEFRKASSRVRSAFPRDGQAAPALYDEWLAWRNPEERFTNESLGYIVDTFPQMVEYFVLDGVDIYSPDFESKSPEEQKRLMKTDTRPNTWYPTLLLNLEMKKPLPEEGVKWLFVRCRAKVIKNGRYDLEIICMDAEGDVIAVSHHVALAVSGSRNTAARRKASSRL